MSTITTILSTDRITDSRAVINTNFSNLNSDKSEKANNLSDLTVPNTALNNILPSQTSNSGKVLGTDGSNTSWVSPSGSPLATNLVQGITALTVAAADPALPKAVGDNDPRVPTQAENDALVGTGTPSSSNKYVTADTDALKELLANKSTTTTLGTSDTLYPTQNAVKVYVDNNVGEKLSVVTTDATWVNTDTNERTWFSISIPASTLSTNNAVKVKAFVSYTITGSSTATKQIKLKYGSTTIYDAGALAQTGTSGTYKGYLEIILVGAGSTSAQEGSISMKLSTDKLGDLTYFVNIAGTGTAAEASGGTLNLLVTIQDGAGNSADTFTASHIIVEKVR